MYGQQIHSRLNYVSKLFSPHLKFTPTFKASKKMSNKSFKFDDYDCIGFDLDNTLLKYNITSLVRLTYDCLAKFLVEKRQYDPACLFEKLAERDIDFLQKGLVMDLDAGNVLKIDWAGRIVRASHGTKFMSDEEIQKIYPSHRWEGTEELQKNTLNVWNGPMSEKLRVVLDYFDIACTLIFARAVDSVDKKGKADPSRYGVWADILDGMTEMYHWKHFKDGRGGLFSAIKNNPEKYLARCSTETIDWLRKLRDQRKVTYLITGSMKDFVSFTASYALGDDWRSLFDIVVCFAKKPGFFTGERPFVLWPEDGEFPEISGNDLEQGGIYCQGNWRELRAFFAKISDNPSPKCLYVGDNLIQDIYAPSAHVECDTVVLNEEMQLEIFKDKKLQHPDEPILNSELWGCYFGDAPGRRSLWAGIIEKYSKICIPSMETVARNPANQSYRCFNEKSGESSGFYPLKPQSID